MIPFLLARVEHVRVKSSWSMVPATSRLAPLAGGALIVAAALAFQQWWTKHRSLR
jgi:hypothetical protein